MSNATEDMIYFPERRITLLVTLLSTLFAELLLVGGIAGLFVVVSQRWRLGLIVLFTALFAATVSLLTNARRVEVFAATAAYVATTSRRNSDEY
jgi:hypothetical protein